MFDIRLRLYSDDGDTRGRVIPTTEISFDGPIDDASDITFKVSETVAGSLPEPFIVALEFSGGGNYAEPRNARFIVKADQNEPTDPNREVTYTGENYLAWLLRWGIIWWRSGDTTTERTYKNTTPGAIMHNLITAAKTLRPWGAQLNIDFSATHDSLGNPWPTADKLTITYPLWTSMWTVLDSFVEQGLLEWFTQGQTLRIVPAGTYGIDRRDSLVLGETGAKVTKRSAFEDIFNSLVVVPDEMKAYQLLNPSAPQRFGQLESVVTQDGITDRTTSERMAQRALADAQRISRELVISYPATNAEQLPWVHYNVGDVIGVRVRGAVEVLSVVSLVVKQDGEGLITVSPVVDRKIRSKARKLSQRVGGQSVAKAVGGAVRAPLPTGKKPIVEPPAAPTGLSLVSNEGWIGPDGLPGATVVIGWNPVELGTDDAAIIVDQYEVWISEGSARRRVTATDGLQATLDLTPGRLTSFMVRAHARSGWSDYSGALLVTPALSYPPQPAAPTGLAVTANTAEFDERGRSRSKVTIAWSPVTTGIDGQPIALAGYDVWAAETQILESRRNYAKDPRGTGSTFWEGNTAVTQSAGPAVGTFATSRRFTRSTTGAARASAIIGTDLTASTLWAARLTVQASVALTSVAVYYRPNVTTSTGQVLLATVSIPAGVSDVIVSGTTSATAPGSSAGISLIWSTGAVGSTLDLTGLLPEKNVATVGTFFDGDTADAAPVIYEWLATPNASPSFVRSPVPIAPPVQVAVTKQTSTTLELTPERTMQVFVRAQGMVGLLAIGMWSAFSAPLDFTPAQVTTAPVAPSVPITITALGGVVVTWDGLLGGAPPAPGFMHVFAEFAREGTEDYARFGSQLTRAGSIQLAGEPVGSEVRIRFRSVNTLGVVSDAGTEVSVVVVGVTGPDIEANAVTANHIEAFSIGVNQLEPGIGGQLDITANEAVVIIAGAVDDTNAALDEMQTVYKFTPTEAVISAKDSNYELAIDNDSIEIREGGVPVSYWNSGQMYVESFVGNTVVLSNHQLEKFGTGTVMRAL